MKYWHLLRANLGRKKLRTVLTVGSFAVALLLFGLLAGIHSAFYAGIDVAGADRLVVINRVSLIQPLPHSYQERLRQVPGVTDVTFGCWFGGVYQDEKNFFAQFAIEPESYHRIYPEYAIPEDQWQAFLADRQGAIAGRDTAERFGWKIGDRIPILGTIFPGTWEFNLRAIYEGTREQDDNTQFWFHYEYLDEGAPRWFHGTVGWYVVRLADPGQAVPVIRAIDERFANSPYETRTATEQEFATSFVKQMGNIQLLVMVIGSVVFFTLLLVTGNTMAMSVRERTAELAVMKTVGFRDRTVLLIVLAEALTVALLGGVVGLALAKSLGDPTGGMLPTFNVSWGALAAGLGLTLLFGLLAGLLPALTAMRLSVVDALRRN
ncbi:MAG: FtsX-like permease family protein [Acidobacteria bacterium]|nr:FtsX-like permease family protein [Acidobacteriota bacterium]